MSKRVVAVSTAIVLAVLAFAGTYLAVQNASAAAQPKFRMSSEFALINEGVVSSSVTVEIYAGTSPTGTLAYSATQTVAPGAEFLVKVKDIAAIPSPFVGYANAYSDQPMTPEFRAHARNLNQTMHNILATSGTVQARWMSGATQLRQDGPFSVAGDQAIDLKDVLSNPPPGYDDIVLASTNTAELEVYNGASFPRILK